MTKKAKNRLVTVVVACLAIAAVFIVLVKAFE